MTIGQDHLIRVLSVYVYIPLGALTETQPAEEYSSFPADTFDEAHVSIGRIMIGLTTSFKKLFREQMSYRQALAGLVIMIFTAALGCVCLAGMQPGENRAKVEKIAVAASDSHIDQTQEAAGTRDLPSPAPPGDGSENSQICCLDEPIPDSMKSGKEIRLLMLNLQAAPPAIAMDVSVNLTPATTISYLQAAAVKPPSLVQLSISRT